MGTYSGKTVEKFSYIATYLSCYPQLGPRSLIKKTSLVKGVRDSRRIILVKFSRILGILRKGFQGISKKYRTRRKGALLRLKPKFRKPNFQPFNT